MTIPTDDLPVLLRHELERELESLGATVDQVGPATIRGERVVRRRRLTAGALVLTTAVLAGVGSAVWSRGEPSTVPNRTAPIATDPDAHTPDPAPRFDPLSDGRVTRREWDRAMSEALTAALPDRYGTVSPVSTDFAVQMYGTEGGSPRLEANLAVNGWLRVERPVRYDDHTCAAINAMRELYACSEERFGDGWLAVVTTDLVAPGNSGPFLEGERVEIPPFDPDDIPDDWSFGTVLTLMNDDVVAELRVMPLGADPLAGVGPAGITDPELLALAKDPEFLELVRVGVQRWYDVPRPKYVVHDGKRVPVFDGTKQQSPPRFPD